MNNTKNAHSLAESFNRFWYQKPDYLKIRNDSRTLENLKGKLAGFSSTEELDTYILETNSHKETLRRIAVAFYQYLRDNENMQIESELEQLRFFDYPFERQLEIAKYLHDPHTISEIKDEFNITEKCVRNDLNALKDGIDVLGTTVQISVEKKGRKRYYRSTLHPVFLPLNLTEVYALTVYMPRIMNSGHPNADIIRSIGERIKLQLSDYALKRLFPDEECRMENHAANNYISDEKLARSRSGILMYLMKSGQSCSFFVNDRKLKGTVRFNNNANTYAIECEDGTILDIKPDEVEFIVEDLEYR